jgi:hypothetical protein
MQCETWILLSVVSRSYRRETPDRLIFRSRHREGATAAVDRAHTQAVSSQQSINNDMTVVFIERLKSIKSDARTPQSASDSSMLADNQSIPLAVVRIGCYDSLDRRVA